MNLVEELLEIVEYCRLRVFVNILRYKIILVRVELLIFLFLIDLFVTLYLVKDIMDIVNF